MSSSDDDLKGFQVHTYECVEPDCPPALRFVAHCTAPPGDHRSKRSYDTMPATVYAATREEARDGLVSFLKDEVQRELKRRANAAATADRMRRRREGAS